MSAPTTTTFKARFPEFVAVSDVFLQVIIDEAVGEVGPSWSEPDRSTAQMYLAAHMLASEGYGAGKATGSATLGAVKRRRVGDVETEYAGSGSSGGVGSGYLTTTYGRRYLELKRRNFPTIAVV